jgi:hypothetical protein
MKALADHYIGQRDTRGQDPHAHFTGLRLGVIFFNHLQCIGPAAVSNDDARVPHGSLVLRAWCPAAADPPPGTMRYSRFS